MKTLKYSELTEREQASVLDNAIEERLAIINAFGYSDFQKELQSFYKCPKDVKSYVLYHSNAAFKNAVDNLAKRCVEEELFILLPRNLNATIIYREEV